MGIPQTLEILGLVSREVLAEGGFNPGNLMPAVITTAEHIAGNAPLAIRQTRKAIHLGLQMALRSALRFKVEAYKRLIDTEDRREGVEAWNEGRKPKFKAR